MQIFSAKNDKKIEKRAFLLTKSDKMGRKAIIFGVNFAKLYRRFGKVSVRDS